MTLKKLDELIVKKKNPPKTVIAAAEDEYVLKAVKDAVKKNLIIPVFIGRKRKIKEISEKINFKIDKYELIDKKDEISSVLEAVKIIKNGNGDILMKGLIQTADFLRTVLDKENGIKKRGVLSHIGIFQSPYYHKLLGVTDAALNIAPNLKEKTEIIKNGVELFNRLGYENPKVAILSAVEVVNPKMQSSIDAALLGVMNKRNQIKNCTIDGPLALDNAISKKAAKHKNIKSNVAGDADLLVVPYIEVGNVLYKTLNFIGGAEVAAVLMGATVPIVLTSRADSPKSKFYSIALASALKTK